MLWSSVTWHNSVFQKRKLVSGGSSSSSSEYGGSSKSGTMTYGQFMATTQDKDSTFLAIGNPAYDNGLTKKVPY